MNTPGLVVTHTLCELQNADLSPISWLESSDIIHILSPSLRSHLNPVKGSSLNSYFLQGPSFPAAWAEYSHCRFLAGKAWRGYRMVGEALVKVEG